MRAAGKVVAACLDACVTACTPGITTRELDQITADTLRTHNSEALFLWYPTYAKGEGFPASTCISVNDEIVHGIPGDRVLQHGDIVTIDCGVRLCGWCADAARSVVVGDASDKTHQLVADAKTLLDLAIKRAQPGTQWSSIAGEMHKWALDRGYGVIREYVGHGIGRKLHELPKVPNYIEQGGMRDDFVLEPGMVLAIEPMLTLGSARTRTRKDGWTVVSADGAVSAHQEHTVAIRSDGPEILSVI